MKMQQSTAKRLVIEISYSLDNVAGTGEDIIMTDVAEALIRDALARDELQNAIDENVDQL